MAVFYIKVIRDGRDAADPDKDPKATSTTADAPSTAKTTTLNANGSLEEAREAVSQLKEKSSCTAKDDAKSLTVFIQAAKKEDKLNKERKLATSTLAALSKNCGAEYTVDLTKQMKKSTSEVSDLVSDRSWWHLASPAPSGAKDVTEFTTGKHNIRCKFDDDDESVSCSIYIYDYPSPDGCENKTATYHLSQAKEATADCNSALNSSIQVAYGSTVSHNEFGVPFPRSRGSPAPASSPAKDSSSSEPRPGFSEGLSDRPFRHV